MVYLWTGERLEGCAFFDAPLHVVSMATVKNFVLLGDVQKSVYFLHFREEKDGLGAGGKHLTQLAKDFDDLQVSEQRHSPGSLQAEYRGWLGVSTRPAGLPHPWGTISCRKAAPLMTQVEKHWPESTYFLLSREEQQASGVSL